jgi:auxin efflux carrier family protein
MSSGGLLESFLAAFQASLSVILTIFYGVLASQFNLLDKSAGKAISKVCVRMFLPALLITKVGSELHLDTATRYIPILSRPLASVSQRIQLLIYLL